MPDAPPPPRVSQAWLLLAVISLGLSALAAIALVLARTPLLSTLVTPDVFPRALVVHVNLATLIWYFSMAGAFWTESGSARARVLLPALAIATAGALGVVASGLFAIGTPVLANYVPYVASPMFLGALALFATGTLCVAAITLHRPRDAAEWGFLLARWPFVMGALYLVVALHDGHPLPEALWGTGHILQFGFVTLLMAIWLRLAERAGARQPVPGMAKFLFAAASAPSTLAPLALLASVYDAGSLHVFHTDLMRWSNWPAALALGSLLLYGGRPSLRISAFPASLALFAVGILAGGAIDSQTTMIPAHYHGTIGAYTLAQMAAVFARLPPSPGTPGSFRHGSLPLTMYAIGIATLIAGLAWSGYLGAPRKTGFVGGAGADLAATLAASLTGIGGAITIAAVIIFVLVAAPRILILCKAPLRSTPVSRADAAGATFAAAR